jgi:hypothetical protein
MTLSTMSTMPAPSPKPSSCVCDDIMCIQAWPQSCHCDNGARMRCWEKCGGPEPTMASCPPIPAIQPVPTPFPGTPVPLPSPLPEPTFEPTPIEKCHVDITCATMWPESCYCENARNKIRNELCGAEFIEPMVRSPLLFLTQVHKTKTKRYADLKTRNVQRCPRRRSRLSRLSSLQLVLTQLTSVAAVSPSNL